jgi:hypothetical protein
LTQVPDNGRLPPPGSQPGRQAPPPCGGTLRNPSFCFRRYIGPPSWQFSHDSPLLAPTLDKLSDLGPLPEQIRVHLGAGYDSQKTRDELAARGMTGQIAHKGDKAPIQASQRWHVERTNAWHNAFNRLQRCYERREEVIDAYFDLADTIITVRSLIRQARTTYRWDSRPARRR